MPLAYAIIDAVGKAYEPNSSWQIAEEQPEETAVGHWRGNRCGD